MVILLYVFCSNEIDSSCYRTAKILDTNQINTPNKICSSYGTNIINNRQTYLRNFLLPNWF